MRDLGLVLLPRRVDGDYVAIALGGPKAEFGDAVTISKTTLYVASVDTLPLNEISIEVVQLLGYPHHAALLQAMATAYAQRVTDAVNTTIYTLFTQPVEQTA